MKKILYHAVVIVFFCCVDNAKADRKEPLIINHKNIDITKIPQQYIKKAQRKFHISYGHTSHGNQIISGMKALAKKDKKFNYTSNPKSDKAFLWDRIPSGDLGNPNQEQWAEKTRKLLEGKGKSRNIIMWSWCGQLSRKATKVEKYLALMNSLEQQFPKVTFIYMTGHLDGNSSKSSVLLKNNEKIRKFCKNHNKVLFDFADIESFDPDGKVDYSKLSARDNCDYKKDGKRKNWAKEWIKNNPKHNFSLPEKAAHTHPLNAAMKGQAFWWMMARLAGWQGLEKNKKKKSNNKTFKIKL
ncbi:hypothetical protein AAEX28_08570 [Lentisphaerota bacterium WC36G]|nr:hypothetical protein LJT99_11425 [Lentisphaerae bacterium WC36]